MQMPQCSVLGRAPKRPHACRVFGLAVSVLFAAGFATRSDAQAPAFLVRDINPSEVVTFTFPEQFMPAGGVTFFAASLLASGGDRELWRTDGTPAGTVLVKARLTLSSHFDNNPLTKAITIMTAMTMRTTSAARRLARCGSCARK